MLHDAVGTFGARKLWAERRCRSGAQYDVQPFLSKCPVLSSAHEALWTPPSPPGSRSICYTRCESMHAVDPIPQSAPHLRVQHTHLGAWSGGWRQGGCSERRRSAGRTSRPAAPPPAAAAGSRCAPRRFRSRRTAACGPRLGPCRTRCTPHPPVHREKMSGLDFDGTDARAIEFGAPSEDAVAHVGRHFLLSRKYGGEAHRNPASITTPATKAHSKPTCEQGIY